MKRQTLMWASFALICSAWGVPFSESKDTPYYDYFSSHRQKMGEDRLNLWPLAYHDENSTSALFLFNSRRDYLSIAPIYSQHTKAKGTSFTLLWPYSDFDFTGDTGWALPFFWSKDSFAAFPFFMAEKGHFYSWVFSSYERGWNAAFGLVGQHWDDNNWLLPLWYADRGSFFSFPLSMTHKGWAGCLGLFGAGRDTSWCLPLFLRTPLSTHTLLASWSNDWQTFFSLPLLSSFNFKDKHGFFLLGLAGRQGGLHWAMPFYIADGDDVTSLIYGRRHHGGICKTWWCTPLVMTTSGLETGVQLGVFLHDQTESADFEDCRRQLDEPKLSKDVFKPFTNSHSTWRSLVLVGQDETIVRKNVDAPKKPFEIVYRNDFEVVPFWGSSDERRVYFDRKTCLRAGETAGESSYFLYGVYASHASHSAKSEYEKSTFLWKVWQKESRNGETRIDAFPFITIDRHKTGASKTSVAGGLYTHETEADGTTHLKLFYISLW